MPAILTVPAPSVVTPAPPVPAATPSAAAIADRAVRRFREGVVKFTFDDALRMMEIGVLPEDSTVELLGGILVYRDCGDSDGRPDVAGAAHDFAIRVIGNHNRHIDTADRCVAMQVTVRLSEDYNPVPDAMILRGTLGDYRNRQPTAADVLCLIEVSDTSYDRDAGEKLAAYARAGVPQYVIVDLRNRRAEVYDGPDVATGTYPLPAIVEAGGAVPLRVGDAGETVPLPLADVLP